MPCTQAKSLQFWTPSSKFYGCLGQTLFWLIKGFGLTWFGLVCFHKSEERTLGCYLLVYCIVHLQCAHSGLSSFPSLLAKLYICMGPKASLLKRPFQNPSNHDFNKFLLNNTWALTHAFGLHLFLWFNKHCNESNEHLGMDGLIK